MNLIKFIILIYIFLLCSCKEQPDSTIDYGVPLNKISFHFEKDKKECDNLFNLIDSIEVIKLETSKDYLIGSISKILCDEDYLYILDERKSKALFKYTKSGEFVLKISNIGKGPGEFTRPTDFFLLSDKLVLLDGFSGKIMFFSKAGVFLNEFSTKTMAERFGKIDTNHFCMLNENKSSKFSSYNVSIIDNNGNTIKKLMKIPPFSKDKNLSLYKPTDYFDKELLYTDIFSNNIFRILKDSVSIKYHFDFGRNSLNAAFLNANKKLTASDLLLILNKKDVVNSIDYFNENSKYFFFQCLKKGDVFQIYYKKEDKRPYIFDYKLFPEWFKYVARPYIYSDSSMFISVFEPHLIENIKKEHLKDISGNMIFSKLNSVIKQTEMSDNPIIITYYFK